MKKLINNNIAVLVLALFVVQGCVTTASVPEKGEDEIILLEGMSKNEIFDKTRQWFSTAFVSGESVVDYEDKEAGTIIGKGIARFSDKTLWQSFDYSQYFSLRVDIKDGKIKTSYTRRKIVSDLHGAVSYVTESQKSAAQASVTRLIEDLKSFLLNKEANKDW